MYITQRPSFDELADLRDKVKSILPLISKLAEGSDIEFFAKNLADEIRSLHLKADDILTLSLDDCV